MSYNPDWIIKYFKIEIMNAFWNANNYFVEEIVVNK